jgi:hypothetical protein
MNIATAFPSKYLRAADLGTATPTVTISHVTNETVGEDSRLVVYFAGKEKGLVLNKTNANAIADLLGPETDDWTDGRIKLVKSRVDYQGKRVDAIRVDAPAQTKGKPAPVVQREPGDELDETDIGF